MSLASYEPERKKIEFKGGSFTVRGLSTEDIAILLQEHFQDFDAIMDSWGNHKQNVFTKDALQDFAINLVKDVPILAAKIIALAAEEPDQVEKVRKLSFPIMLEALLTSFQLCFEEVGGVGKWFERMGPTLKRLLPSSAIEGLGRLAEERQMERKAQKANRTR